MMQGLPPRELHRPVSDGSTLPGRSVFQLLSAHRCEERGFDRDDVHPLNAKTPALSMADAGCHGMQACLTSRAADAGAAKQLGDI